MPPALAHAIHGLDPQWEPGDKTVLLSIDPDDLPLSMTIEEFRATVGRFNQKLNEIDRAARNVVRFPRQKRPARQPTASAETGDSPPA